MLQNNLFLTKIRLKITLLLKKVWYYDKTAVSLHQQNNKTTKQQNLKTLKIMNVYFFFEPDESAKFKKAFEEHKLAKRLVNECFSGKYNVVVYEFCYFDNDKLLKISKHLGTYPNMPNFII